MSSSDDARPDSHYFEPDPATPSAPRSITVALADLRLELLADRGVFSSERLDPGTKVLLNELPSVTGDPATVLDLGCGWGPIACVVAKRAPHSAIWAVDVNERALALTESNASRLNLTNVTVVHADDVPEGLTFDRIVSNPPIRIGKSALHAMLATWLDRLTPTGTAHLVVQRHLGSDSLARWLRERGHRVDRIASRLGYRVLEVGAPSTGEPR